MSASKTVVLTGGTRGIGYGLADAFLVQGCRVVISGRREESVAEAVGWLAAKHGAERVWGQACDVTQPDQVQALWDGSRARFGAIHIWINNAGIGHPMQTLWELDPATLRSVVETNLLGTLLGARVAVRGMLEQGFGAVYNLEGMGSDGRKQAGVNLYGCTKAAVAYVTDALIQETRGTPVRIGALRPGMVLTELITEPFDGRPEEWERFKPILNILGERVETVAPNLARRMLAQDTTGKRIRTLTPAKTALRFLAAPFRRRRVVE